LSLVATNAASTFSLHGSGPVPITGADGRTQETHLGGARKLTARPGAAG